MGLFDTIKKPSSSSSPKGMPPKPTTPPKPIDTSVFKGKSYFTEKQGTEWMRKHREEIFKTTKGQVTKDKIPEYEKKLFGSPKWGSAIEKNKHEPEKIKKEMQKELSRAKNSRERYEIRRNMEVINKMFGSGKK